MRGGPWRLKRAIRPSQTSKIALPLKVQIPNHHRSWCTLFPGIQGIRSKKVSFLFVGPSNLYLWILTISSWRLITQSSPVCNSWPTHIHSKETLCLNLRVRPICPTRMFRKRNKILTITFSTAFIPLSWARISSTKTMICP